MFKNSDLCFIFWCLYWELDLISLTYTRITKCKDAKGMSIWIWTSRTCSRFSSSSNIAIYSEETEGKKYCKICLQRLFKIILSACPSRSNNQFIKIIPPVRYQSICRTAKRKVYFGHYIVFPSCASNASG